MKTDTQTSDARSVSLSSAKILIVDDEESLRSFMEIMLSKEGYQVTTRASGAEALETLGKKKFDLIVSDLMMPDMTGLELLDKVKQKNAEQKFIVMTAYGSVDSAIETMKLGAADYITKPFNIDQVKLTISRTLVHSKLAKENVALKKELGRKHSFANIIGASEELKEVIKLAEQISQSDSTALIRGESGVGKDLFAQAIHNAGERASGPYVTINCAALPESLLESELFGHKKGAFTGAIRDKLGLFQAADKGTLFLDEIGDISPAMQVKLLRVIEDHLVTPLGETKPVQVDVRIIAATNANLEEAVDAGTFRADLYYRLNVIQLDIPSLRERSDDILVLVEVFIEKFCKRLKKTELSFSKEALQTLLDYPWPGNVRELENTIERAALLCKGSEIEVSDFPERITIKKTEQDSVVSNTSQSEPSNPSLDIIEKAYIHFVMSQTGGNKAKAAKILRIDSSTLYRRLERYGWAKKIFSM